MEKEVSKLLAEVKKLKAENKKLKSRKKYGIVWEEEKEPEQVVLDCKKKLPILRDIKNKEIITDKNKPMNILIEGDNYHSLQVLNYTHKGKIDVIYIDPPYNTGNKSWKYNNDYVEKEDDFKHSKWLNMMSKRLRIAKNLLSKKGVLICAIDEHERATLGLLLEEIFYNYKIDCVTIVHNPRGVQGKNFSYNHEYTYFVYPDDGDIYIENRDRDKPLIRNFRVDGSNSPRETAKTCFYPFYIKNNKVIGFGDVANEDYHPKKQTKLLKDGFYEIWPIDVNGIERKWSYSRNTVEEIKDQFLIKSKNGKVEVYRVKKETPYKTVWIGAKYDANDYGSKLVKRITGKVFPFPKSLYNVKECLTAVIKNKPNTIVLDYFAGSGTTAHAVLDMNEEDSGRRKFILCTNNEGDICEDVTYPRMHNLIKGYRFNGNEKKTLLEIDITPKIFTDAEKIKRDIELILDKNEDKFDKISTSVDNGRFLLIGTKKIKDKKEGLGGNLKYFKTDFIDVENVQNVSDDKKIELTYQAGEIIAIREDIFEEVEKNKWWQIFKNRKKTVAIYFREDQTKLENLLEKLSKYKRAVLYLFSWGKNEIKGEEYGYDNIKIKDIPQPIIEVYKEINRL